MRASLLLLIIPIVFFGFKSQNQIAENNFSTAFAGDTIIYPKTDTNYVVKVLKPGIYNISDINYDASTMEWYALMNNGAGYFIRKFIPNQTKIKDDKGVEKWEIKGHDSLKIVMMFSGIELLEKDVIEMKLGTRAFGPGDLLQLNYSGKKMEISAQADEVKNKTTKKMDIVKYKLYISNKKGKMKTLLAQHKILEDSKPSIIFMGDLDNDKKPDLIINNTNKLNVNHVTLYLSNNPVKGTLYKVMGIFNYTE